MGAQVVLVIGDNFRDQLDKYRNTAPASSPHWVAVDKFAEVTQEHATVKNSFLKHVDGSLHDPWAPQFMRDIEGRKFQFVPAGYAPVLLPAKGNISFEKWVRRTYGGLGILADGEEPNFLGEHAGGWVRVNARGEIVELMMRIIPECFFDYFESTQNSFLLKPGAQGVVIDEGEGDAAPATTCFAGSATKGAIDFAAMREAMRAAATERWDRAAAASDSKPWESFKTIWEKFESQPFSMELRITAKRQWAAQPAVRAILDDCSMFPDLPLRVAAPPATGIIEASQMDKARWEQMSAIELRAASLVWSNESENGIDLLALSRAEYVQRFRLWDLLGHGEVIKDGNLMGPFDETELFDSLSDETVLTLAIVHC
jgi:ribonuclease HI